MLHWTRSSFPQLTTPNRLHGYWWNRWNRQIWIFPSIPNTDTMYINSGAIYVHSATGVLTVRGNKQLYLRGGITSGVRGMTNIIKKYFLRLNFSPLCDGFFLPKLSVKNSLVIVHPLLPTSYSFCVKQFKSKLHSLHIDDTLYLENSVIV